MLQFHFDLNESEIQMDIQYARKNPEIKQQHTKSLTAENTNKLLHA